MIGSSLDAFLKEEGIYNHCMRLAKWYIFVDSRWFKWA
jgi:hypothetical protein